MVLAGDTEEVGLSLTQEFSLAREGLITHIGHLSPGVQHPLTGCKECKDNETQIIE